MKELHFLPNEGKSLCIQTENGRFARYPVKTHVVMTGERLRDLMERYICEFADKTDWLFISEKVVAICQGRAFSIDSIKPRPLAKLLCRFVYKSPHGIGLGSPWTMELALRDVGIPRILLACAGSALTKPFGLRGVFYRIAGTAARAIDGPCENTIAPYCRYAKLAPAEPDRVAGEIEAQTGCKTVVIDANDLGVEVLGRSDPSVSIAFCKQVFADNPLGQGSQSTPFCIVRKMDGGGV